MDTLVDRRSISGGGARLHPAPTCKFAKRIAPTICATAITSSPPDAGATDVDMIVDSVPDAAAFAAGG